MKKLGGDTGNIALIILGGVFVFEALAAAYVGKLPTIPDALFPFLLGAAAFRAGRAVSDNLIFKWLRDWLGIVVIDDTSGAGQSTDIPKEITGARRVICELVCCPICSGTWAAIILLEVHSLFPALGNVLVLALGGAGIAEVMHWAAEKFGWQGRQAREAAGSYWLEKNKQTTLPEGWVVASDDASNDQHQETIQ